MSTLRQSIKERMPDPLLQVARDAWDVSGRLKDWPSVTFHPWRRESVRRIQALKDTRKGERCFIIGNGPSLRDTDLTRLKDEFTIGMNRFYLLFPELGFTTSYYVSINDLVIEQCAADIQNMQVPRFVSWHSRKYLKMDDSLHFLYTTYNGPKFATRASGRLWEGATVTNVALQLAYHLGFQQAVLIGVDHNFVTQGKPNTTVVSQGDDPNHFSPGYFGKGFRWQLPDLETSERGYQLARQAYERDGREVIDATIGGKLRIFNRVEYDSLFHS